MSLRKLKTRKKSNQWPILAIASLSIICGIYMLLLAATPFITPIDQSAVLNDLKKQPTITENRLYVPVMGINVPINEIKNGNDAQALLDGAAHRAPTSGNPKDGGNFVLAAHRFSFGITPRNVTEKSPFFHIDKLKIGDILYVDWNGKRYRYRTSKIFTVKPTEVSIEAATDEPVMTLYSCGLGGERDNRQVIRAELLKELDSSEL